MSVTLAAGEYFPLQSWWCKLSQTRADIAVSVTWGSRVPPYFLTAKGQELISLCLLRGLAPGAGAWEALICSEWPLLAR